MTPAKLRDPVPPAAGRPAGLPPSRLLSWLITSVIVGWVIVYNIFRFTGSSPRDAAPVSFLIGLGVGAIIFGVSILVWRRVSASPRYQAHHMDEIPPPSRLDARQRTALDILWPAVAVLAAAALVLGVGMAIEWWGDDTERGITRIVIAGWDVLVAVWLTTEVVELRRHHGEAVESIGTAALLTAVLSGVALSRDVLPAMNGALVVIAGVTGALAYFAGWRLLGSRGIPFAAVGAVLVAAAAVVLPLVV